MDRVFLDANVLFSAAYSPDSALLRLWQVRDAELITSAYAVHEVMANMAGDQMQGRLGEPLSAVQIVPEAPHVALPAAIGLPAADRPILQAAIAVGAAYLLTGDKAHFGRYYRRALHGVRVLPPAEYLCTK
jgi:predicted nucleic acid-binding protein